MDPILEADVSTTVIIKAEGLSGFVFVCNETINTPNAV